MTNTNKNPNKMIENWLERCIYSNESKGVNVVHLELVDLFKITSATDLTITPLHNVQSNEKKYNLRSLNSSDK